MKIFSVGNPSINLYLLDSGTHRLLIDSGYPDQLNVLGRQMRQPGFKISDIDYLIVTHFHVDHAGAIQELKSAGVQFILFDIQAAFINPMESMITGKWRYTPLTTQDNLILSPDESAAFFKQLNIDGQVIATPGHSYDSITLLLDSGEAFTGDLLAENLILDEASQEKKSWLKLRSLGAKIVYPGHGPVYTIIK
ncbi:MAG: MBL fold metallo-hydrolase [Paludibacter sp.]|nr:MBL fold metallo-hydrolase [Paludibacter sp.]